MDEVRADLAALYHQHKNAMHGIAAMVLRDVGLASEAPEAVQDAMVSILESPPEGVRSWEAFLVTAAKRKALDRVRSARVRHSGPALSETGHDFADGTDTAEDVADAIDLQRRAGYVWDALPILNEQRRKVAWGVVAKERPRGEIAAELGVTPGRVSQIRKEALAELRDIVLKAEEEDHEERRA